MNNKRKYNNSLDLIRLIASLMVLFSHSYILYDGESNDGLYYLTKYINFGDLAVAIFFCISGQLIYESILRSKGFVDFCTKRIKRLIPGLLVCVVLTSLVSYYMVFDDIGFADYWMSNLLVSYISNIFFIGGFKLPLLFDNNPYPYVANGSLWTLRYEVLMYAFLSLYFIWFVRTRVIYLFIPLFIIYVLTVFFDVGVLLKNSAYLGSVFFLSIYLKKEMKITCFFIACFIFSLLFSNTLLFVLKPIFLVVLTRLIILFLEWLYLLIKFELKYDFSYGLYIYGFFVQQCIMKFYIPSSVFYFFLLSVGLTLPVAFFSWYFVESKFLKNKKGIA